MIVACMSMLGLLPACAGSDEAEVSVEVESNPTIEVDLRVESEQGQSSEVAQTTQEQEEPAQEASKELKATMKTNKGDIHLKLFADETPLTVANFVNLAQRGYYDGLKFHRVIDDFMIQGGCPLGTGSGDPGYKFQDEFNPQLKHSKPGILSMANSGPGTNGSQFFITHVPTPHLDGKHTVFGEVVGPEDQQVVNKITDSDRILELIIEGDASDLLAGQKAQIDEWNKILDVKFPKK